MGEFVPLIFKPGINRERTLYANKGGWWDSDKVRFQQGVPEKIGGWVKYTVAAADGEIRQLKQFRTLSGTVYTAVGTSNRLYLERGEALYDITPLRTSATLGTDPLTTSSGSATITVAHTSHGAYENDLIEISGATATNGIPADEINSIHNVVNVTANTYEIVVTTTASSSGTGGGSAVDVDYYIHSGSGTVALGDGWGAGTWGRDTWGSGTDISVEVGGGLIRLWSFDTFGEDFVSCVRNGGLYYWDASTGDGVRAFPFSSLSGASNTPSVAVCAFVSDRSRHVVALGSDSLDNPGVQDPMLIRWSDREDAANWTPSTTSTAGNIPLGRGTRIVGYEKTRQETLIWTDSALYAMRWVGGNYVFGVEVLSENTALIGMNASVAHGSQVYWMGDHGFYVYDGVVRKLRCDVEDYIFDRLNQDQVDKIYAGSLGHQGEVTWFYPATGMDENDSYVTYNFMDDIWYFGSMTRTAWLDSGLSELPIAAGTDGYLYYHETGVVDGSTEPASRIIAHIESSPMEIGEGRRFTFIKRLIPDITFDPSSTAEAPNANFIIKMRNAPGLGDLATTTEGVDRTATVPVETYDDEKWVRLRGRSFIFRIEDQDDETQAGVSWRVGVPRLEIRQDGRR